VARREYLERVRSKAFMISTVLGPLIMGGLIFGPALIMKRQSGKPLRLAVLDEDKSGTLGPKVEAGLRERLRDNGTTRFEVVPPEARPPPRTRGPRCASRWCEGGSTPIWCCRPTPSTRPPSSTTART
jgi:ABC-2 type transport system permease protein